MVGLNSAEEKTRGVHDQLDFLGVIASVMEQTSIACSMTPCTVIEIFPFIAVNFSKLGCLKLTHKKYTDP